MALVVVDAENVRRSQWPNVSREDLGRRARDWAAREGHERLVTSDRALSERVADAPERIIGGGSFVPNDLTGRVTPG